MTPTPSVIAELAPSGVLRAAVNLANAAIVHIGADGDPAGPAVDLARTFADLAGLPLELWPHPSAGRIVEAEAQGGGWDIAFLAIDPARAERLHFSPPYRDIGACFAVPATSPVAALADLDRPGVRIASARGAAYQSHLERTLRAATLIAHDDPAAALGAFLAGGFDALAGVHAALETALPGGAPFRLTRPFLRIEQAVAVPRGRPLAAEWIDVVVTAYRAPERITG